MDDTIDEIILVTSIKTAFEMLADSFLVEEREMKKYECLIINRGRK